MAALSLNHDGFAECGGDCRRKVAGAQCRLANPMSTPVITLLAVPRRRRTSHPRQRRRPIFNWPSATRSTLSKTMWRQPTQEGLYKGGTPPHSGSDAGSRAPSKQPKLHHRLPLQRCWALRFIKGDKKSDVQCSGGTVVKTPSSSESVFGLRARQAAFQVSSFGEESHDEVALYAFNPRRTLSFASGIPSRHISSGSKASPHLLALPSGPRNFPGQRQTTLPAQTQPSARRHSASWSTSLC